MKRTTSKILSLTLSLALTCGLFAPQALAAESGFNDTAGHWAEAAIDRWSGYGIVQGYDGHFDPDGTLTRAQMAAVLSNALGLTQAAENPFADVEAGAWYTPYVLRCYAAGVMEGSGANANPDAQITRQETMVMLCRALGIAPAEQPDLSAFADGSEVASWAVPCVSALTAAGIVGGVGNGQLAPMGDMTRASLMTVLDRAIIQYINTPGTYELAGEGGLILVASGDVTLTGKTAANILVTPAAQGKTLTFDKAEVTGAVTVQAKDIIVTVKDSTLPKIEGVEVKTENAKPTTSKGHGGGGGGSNTPTVSDLTVAEGKTVEAGTYKNVIITDAVADGEVILSGLTIQGDLTVNGGGSSSIKLVNCTVGGKVVLDKTGGQPPRLYLTNTPVARVEAEKPAIIEAADAASAVAAVETKAKLEVKGENTTIASVTVPAGVESAVEVAVTAGTVSKVEAQGETTIKGDVAAVTAQAPVTIASGTVGRVEVPTTVSEAVAVTVDAAAAVNQIDAKGEASVAATGSVGTVTAEKSVTITSGTVEKVEVPSTAAGSVTVSVGSGATVSDVAVNSANGAAITGEGAVTNVSSDLEEAPAITLNGAPVTHIHKWGKGEETKAPTCTEAGVLTYTCTAEGCTEPPAAKTETIPALGHTVVIDPAVAATCTEAGKTEGKHCSVCNAVLTAQETVPALGHKWGAWTADGENHTRVCANDASHTETKPHTVVTDPAVAATCTEAGKTEGSHCSDCNAVLKAQETIPALGHDFTGDYKSDGDGHWHQCIRCDATDVKDAHTFDATDCDQAANCTVCGYEKPAGEHSYGKPVVTKAATCTEAGSQTETCAVCGKQIVTVIPQLDHTWGAWASVDETNHKHTCSVCGTEATEAHAWDEGTVTKEPTDTEPGVKTFTCTVCGGTKTEALPLKKQVSLTLDPSTHKLTLNFTKPAEYTSFGLYCYDSDGNQVGYGFIYDGFDATAVIPCTDIFGTYTLVVKGWGDGVQTAEVARLNNCVEVSVAGSPVDYNLEFNSGNAGQHKITWKDGIPTGLLQMSEWRRESDNTSKRGCGSITQGLTSNFELQDGDVFDLRIVTSYTLENQVVKLTITPASTKTYATPSVP